MSRIGSMSGMFGVAAPVVVLPAENYSGAVMLFVQTSAPPGWTKQTDNDDCALRCVTGSSLSTGGVNGFTSTFSDRTFGGTATVSAGTTGATTISTPQLPNHSHTFAGGYSTTKTVHFGSIPTAAPVRVYRPWPNAYSVNNGGGAGGSAWTIGPGVPWPGGITNAWVGGAHTHSIPEYTRTNSSIGTFGLAVKYVDVIVASKD